MINRYSIFSLAAAFMVLFMVEVGHAAAFEITTFEGSLTGPGRVAEHQAGSHPDLTTTIAFPTVEGEGGVALDENVKDIQVQLPEGLIGDPSATPKCSQADLGGKLGPGENFTANCPVTSQVGTTLVTSLLGGSPQTVPEPVYNLEPPAGVAAEFGFNFASVLVFIDARLASYGGYRVEARITNVSQAIALVKDELTLWGVPADPSHDAQRNERASGATGASDPAPALPFLTAPTSCTNAPAGFRIEADSWQDPGAFAEASFDHDPSGNPIQFGGCETLGFEASLQAQPTSHEADAPTGLDVTLSVPQNRAPEGLATAQLRDATIELPAGMTVNPAGATGVTSCSAAQIDLDGEAAATCPESSKIGSVEIITPLLEQPLEGGVYLARQGENKFGSLLAIYIAVADPATGTVLKLPGRIAADPGDGRLTATFEDNPQVPFSRLRVSLFGGPRAPLRTPPTCGTYVTRGSFTPWSGTAPIAATDSFQVTGGPGGTACPTGAFDPALFATSADPTGGSYSPLELRVTRPDASPALDALGVTLPTGLLAKLAGLQYCPDAALARVPGGEGTAALQLASPSCPPASRVGSVSAAAGAGSYPFYLDTGSAYLAGPYKGAPLSLAIVTPALAGPFDLGNVVVRAALYVDPETAQVRAVSDPLPTILDGIPLDLRELRVDASREGFILNPTNCAPAQVTAEAGAVGGATAKLAAPFGVTGCGALGFAPKLALRLSGGTTRAKDPALRAVLQAPAHEAGIGRAQVILPKTEFIDNAHIGSSCTRPQFAAEACPANSVLGHATAYTPLLDQPLTGTVYLRSNGGARKLPDLAIALKGQIDVTLVGFIDSVHKKGGPSRIRTTFATVPDAPISKFVLQLLGSKHGLLQNNTNLCRGTLRATVRLTGQNGKSADSSPRIAATCPKQRHPSGGR